MTRVFERDAAAATDGFDAALQGAQLDLLADPVTAHPVHWAGFSLIGGNTPGAKP
jgi:CHAT domain-containing protein